MEVTCSVCSKIFSSKSNRLKHERTSKTCSQRDMPAVMLTRVAGEVVTIAAVEEMEEERVVTLGLGEGEEGGRRCRYCRHTFARAWNADRHHCPLGPGIGAHYQVLRLVEEGVGQVFREHHRGNSDAQVLGTCFTLGQAVPGAFPLIFPTQSTTGNAKSSLRSRLEELGSVGAPAYAALREAVKDQGELHLPLYITIVLPEGGMISMGPDLTLPTNLKELGSMSVRQEGTTFIALCRLMRYKNPLD